MPALMDADVARRVIRQRLEEGRLPHGQMMELGYGQGIGQLCDGCGESITWHQRMTVRICRADWRTVRLHGDCFEIWDAERQARDEREG
jgi:hypothetical protein